MDLGLKGKVAIVTGGSRGLGEGIVEGFVKEDANVVIGDVDLEAARKTAKKLAGEGVRVLAFQTDVSDKSNADNLVSTTIREFGKIDILVNNAGIVRPHMLLDIEEDEWNRVLAVNAKGVYLMSRAVVPHMIAARNGKIVNISSHSGKEGHASECAYAASKFAVRGFTQALANEVAQYNINVNAVCPGIIHTFMWDQVIDVRGNVSDLGNEATFDEKFTKVCEREIPLKRPQFPQDIANVVLFLSSEVSRNMTGQSINVCGGMRMD